MNEVEKEKIRKDARRIMEDFGATLNKVKTREKKKENQVGGFREEGAGESASEDFRQRMFDNAPGRKGDFLISEKKKW